MYFDRRKPYRLQRIADGHARVSVSRRVDHYSIGPVEKRLADMVDQRALAVALEKVRLHTQLFRDFAKASLYLRQSDGSVDFHLPASQKIQVRSIDN